MSDVTLLYYTNNAEPEPFFSNIQANITKRIGDIPIVSVSQKPIDFGVNICVGEVGSSHFNIYRQVLIGLENIDTPFTLVAEHDTLYPPEYFQPPQPERHRAYGYANVWLLFRKGKKQYYFKGYSECARLADTQDWRAYLQKALEGKPMWAGREAKHTIPGKCHLPITHEWTGQPVVSFKTGNGISSGRSSTDATQETLPLWGNAYRLWKAMGL